MAMIESGNAAGTVATVFRAFRAVYNKAEGEGHTGAPQSFPPVQAGPGAALPEDEADGR
jgi:hypothetical protein